MIKASGLSTEEANKRQKIHGKNEVKRTYKISPFKIFFTQFTSPLIIILLVAALISVLIGFLPDQEPSYTDAILIVIIVFISGISGFFQEYKAEKSIEALQNMSTPIIQVFRDGKVVELSVTEITIDDVVLLEAGDIIPADGQILESFGVKVDESILTGESDAVDKKIGEDLYMNTSVSIGSAKMLITQIGMQTRVGKIADKLQKIKKEKTSFELEIEKFSKNIFWIIGVIIVVVFIGNYFKYDLYTSLLTAVSLAVAAIPEGLPAVVALSLALGANVMYKNNALVRKLGVVESIGAVDIICSDKTGTITKNEMTVTHLYINNRIINIGSIDISQEEQKEISPLIKCGVLCNNTITEGHPEGNRKYLGEQTEIGLMKLGDKFGLLNEDLSERQVRVDELPFSSERKMMSVVVRDDLSKLAKLKLYAKGAPEVILEKCNWILLNGKVKKLSLDKKKELLNQNNNFAVNALRVLGFAYKDLKESDKNVETDLIWIGLQAMTDPPHPEVINVLHDCKTAGIRVIMITGDNAVTAKAVANVIGLKSKGVVEGGEIDQLDEKELENKLNSGINIFSRTTPFHKLRILQILKKNNRVVMTGDGVNDSLALKQANVGIAMGTKGSTVAKEASDMIILDDNFSTIVTAIKEGRRIFDNIKKFINYLLVSNFAEVSVLFLSTLFLTLDKPILLPVQILWINLLTDGLPALALGADPARPDIMLSPPRKRGAPIIGKKLGLLIGAIGVKKTIILFLTFFIILPYGEELARSALFTGFILYEFVRIASIRYQDKLSWLSNPWLLIALFSSLLLQLIIMYTPLRSFFHLVALGVFEWVVLLIGTLVGYVLAILITKLVDKYVKIID